MLTTFFSTLLYIHTSCTCYNNVLTSLCDRKFFCLFLNWSTCCLRTKYSLLINKQQQNNFSFSLLSYKGFQNVLTNNNIIHHPPGEEFYHKQLKTYFCSIPNCIPNQPCSMTIVVQTNYCVSVTKTYFKFLFDRLSVSISATIRFSSLSLSCWACIWCSSLL